MEQPFHAKCKRLGLYPVHPSQQHVITGPALGNDPAGEQQQTGTVDELVWGAEICRYGSFCDEADKMLKDKVLDGFSSAPLT